MIEDHNTDKSTPAKRSTRRPTIGLLIRNVSDWVFQQSWLGVVDVAREHDVNLICFPGGALRSSYGFEVQANVLYDLVNVEQLDGLFIKSSNLGIFLAPDEMAEFDKRYQAVPVVTSAPTTRSHDIHDLMLHLIDEHGACRIAFVRGPEGHKGAQERYKSYLDTLAESGLPFDPTLVVAADQGWMERTEIRRFLDRRVLPDQLDFDAVIGVNDQRVLIMMEELQARGVRVPYDVAVGGADDRPEGRIAVPSLTSNHTSLYEQGRKCAEMLLARMRGEPVPERIDISLSEKLMVRRSCGCVPMTVTCAAVDPASLFQEGEGKSFEAMVTRQRSTIVTEIVEVVETRAAEIASDGAEQLLEAFVSEMQGHSPGAFVSALERVLSQVMAAGDEVLMWQQAISILRCHVLSCLPDRTTVVQAENLWGQARAMITEMSQQAVLKRQLERDRQTATLREISGTLATTFNVATLMEILARELPRLEIPGCYVSLYEDPADPTEWSRLILAYNKEERVELEAGGRRFPSSHLVPDGILPQDRQYSLVVEPLYFQDEQIGFVLFEIGPREGSIYGALSRQISSALKGALLVQKVESHTVSLESEVRARTADLDATNTQLQQEIHERKHTEESLRQALDWQQAIFEGSRDAIFISDSDSRFVSVNRAACELTGYAEEALLSMQIPHLFEETDLEEYQILHARMMAGEEITDEATIVRNDTSNVDVEFSSRRIIISNVPYMHIAVRDITNRKRSEEERERLIAELEAKNSELERFTYTVSHDLKSPLITIKGFLGLLEQDATKGDIEQLRRDIRYIGEATDTMYQLLNDLLELSRIGRMMNPPQEVPFGELAHEVVESVAGQIAERGVHVTITPDFPSVYGDRLRLLEVLQNLLENAIKFLGDQPEPQIEIGAKPGVDGSVLYVADSGMGIEPKYQEKVFGLFERLDPGIEGTGVGLAIVKRIVEVHGGRIWVESEGQGHGSTFYFTLPQKEASISHE